MKKFLLVLALLVFAGCGGGVDMGTEDGVRIAGKAVKIGTALALRANPGYMEGATVACGVLQGKVVAGDYIDLHNTIVDMVGGLSDDAFLNALIVSELEDEMGRLGIDLSNPLPIGADVPNMATRMEAAGVWVGYFCEGVQIAGVAQ